MSESTARKGGAFSCIFHFFAFQAVEFTFRTDVIDKKTDIL